MSKQGKAFLIFSLFLILKTIKSQEYKCNFVSQTNQTVCNGQNQDLDIKTELERISEQLDESERVMQLLLITNSSIKELPENAFSELGFESIEILNGRQFSRIHTNAFSDKMVTHLVHEIMIENPSNLENNPQNFDLFKALNSLKNIGLIEISLKELTFHEIPDNAFIEPQNNLKYLSFDATFSQKSGYGFSRIGNNSFIGLSSLTSLSFRNIVIKEMSSDAFNIEESSDDILFINLENCQLLDSTIENDSFIGANRPITLNLALNSIEYIREEKFGKFLNESEKNLIEFYGNTMNCADTQPFLWLLSNKEKFEHRIKGAVCYDLTSIWDIPITVDYVYKCQVLKERNQTVCDGKNGQDLDIKAEMERLNQQLDESEKVMQLLLIDNSSIKELPENAFSELAFESIKILNGKQFSRIHTNAFSDKMVTHLIHQIYIEGPTKLANTPPTYNLWKALNSLSNIALIQISLRDEYLHTLPTNAFSEPQNNLKYLSFDPSFYGYSAFSSIESNSIVGLSKLSALSFRNVFVLSISSDAFNINQTSDERLFINLEDCVIFEKSITSDSFTGTNRPVTVNLASNFFEYIREEKFGKFLNEDKRNLLQFHGNYMNCKDTQPFLWLLNNKAEYEHRIKGAVCSDGITSIWDFHISSGVIPLPIPSLPSLFLTLILLFSISKIYTTIE